MKEGTSISPWSSLVNSRFSESALSRVPRGLHLQTMDSELESLTQAVFQARRMRNRRAGPCTLPAEIIAYIFEYLQSSWPPLREHFHSEDAGFYSGWMSVTHVCSRWRDVALSIPSLWSKPTLDILNISHYYIPDILFRSQLTLLDLELDWEGDFDFITKGGGLNAWLSPSICRRARRLDIAAGIDLIGFAATRLPQSNDMGQLRELGITICDVDYDPDLPVPFHNLAGLTSLTLSGCLAPWQSPLFSSHLTKLSLVQNENSFRPSYDDVRTLVVRLDSLETLYWEDVVPISEPGGPHLPVITFPKSLQQLEILVVREEMALDGLAFVSRISTRPQCARSYTIPQIGRNSVPDMALINDALERLLPDLFARCDDIKDRCLELTSARIRVLGRSVASVQSASPSSHLSQYKSRLVTNGLQIPAFTNRTPPISFCLSDHVSLVALEHLHTISLDISTIHDLAQHNTWSRLLRAKEVRKIGVMKPMMKTMHTIIVQLLDALGKCHVPDAGDTALVLFPRLDVLALPLFEDEMVHGDLVVGLINLVHARREQGAPLRELVIPQEAAGWSVWNTLKTTLKISSIDYPPYISPITPVYT